MMKSLLYSSKLGKNLNLATKATVLCIALVLSVGCEKSREALGLNKRAPDEFAVVTRAPLVVPPEPTLRPPEPGLRRPQEHQPRKQAQVALFDDKADSNRTEDSDLSMAELVLLERSGADGADPDIRTVLLQDSSRYVVRDPNFLDRLMFWREPMSDDYLVDARRESERLQENASADRSSTDGETPVIIERKNKALLEGIF